MHIATKIFVAIASILGLLVAALTAAYAVNVDRITADYRAEVTRRVKADAELSAAKAQALQEITALSAARDAEAAKVADLTLAITTLERERAQLQSQARDAIIRADAASQDISKQTATVDTQAKLIAAYRDEVTQLRLAELEFRKKEIELVDRLNDLESQLEVYDQSTRALREQLAEAQTELSRYRESGAVIGASTGTEPFTPTIQITGRVVEVRRDAQTGETIVHIDVGQNQQVRENMKLKIARDGTGWLANVVVVKTDLQWSLAKVVLKDPRASIQTGDRVISVPSL